MSTQRRSSRSPRGAAAACLAIVPVALIAGGCARGESVMTGEPAAGGDALRTLGASSSHRPAAAETPRALETDAVIVERLSQARCSREEWCSNVGAGQAFASREVCLDTMRGGFGNDINEYRCPQGVDGVRLERCALAIQREQCDEPLDTITRMDKCRAASLCVQ